MSEEIWKPVVDWEGFYEVSDLGRVRSMDRSILDSIGRNRRLKGTVLSPGRNRLDVGYLQVHLQRIGYSEMKFVHHLVLRAFMGDRPLHTETRHLDGDNVNCRLDNLCYGTSTENSDDCLRHGTRARGERHGMARLVPSDIEEIRNKSTSLTHREIARLYGVSRGHIRDIIKRRKWSHVP